jgi:uncharacterized protein YjdB
MKEKSKIYFKWLNSCLTAGILAIAFFAFLTVSCGEDDNDSEISEVSIAPYKHSLRRGTSAVLTANFLPVNTANGTLSWSSSDPNVVSVNPSGAVTAGITAIAVGTATVTVSTSNGKTATSDISVTPAVPLTDIRIMPLTIPTLVAGDTLRLTAAPAPSDAPDFEPEWTSSDATVATVDKTGLVTSVAAGNVTVTASYFGATKSVDITVIPAVPLTGIRLTPDVSVVLAGVVMQFSAAPIPENTTSELLPSWSSSKPGVATISETGLFTAVASGTTTVTITSGNVTKTVDITVVSLEEFLKNSKGYWTFNDPSNIAKAITGAPLDVVIDEAKGGTPITTVGTGVVRVPTRSYFIARHGIAGVGGSVKEYSILIDFNMPSHANGEYNTLLQTDLSNSNDADCFINRSNQIGVGASGYSASVVTPETWYRVIITRQESDGIVSYDIYLDGTNILHSNNGDGRLILSPDGVVLFGDEDGEDKDLDVSTVAIWDRALTAEEIALIGGADF